MMRVLAIVLTLCALGSASLAHAAGTRRVEVRVVDIAGDHAFLSAGSEKGITAGARVYFGKIERRVDRVTRSFAVVSAARLRVGARGVAKISSEEQDEQRRLAAVRPLAAFKGMWPEIERPATQQTPKPILLGRMQGGASGVDATLTASGAALVPLEGKEGAVGRSELRARVEAPIARSFPLTVMGDVALQRWFGRYTTGVSSGDPRPWVRVRELGLAVGDAGDYRAQLGRVRYAAANLGPIDGARAETARIGPLRIAAFGGLLPDPIDNRASLQSGRFGAEFALSSDKLKTHPELLLVAQGSVTSGKLDERRLYAQGQLWPGSHRISGYAQASMFDAKNPWKRPRAEITSAGVDADFRFDDVRLGARFDMRKPERSYWLQRSFPSTWLCSSASATVPSVACTGKDDTRYVVQGYGGWDLRVVQLDAGSAYSTSSQKELGHDAFGYGTVRFPHVGQRYNLALGGSMEGGSLLVANHTLRADMGVGLLDERVRLNLYYRPTYRKYNASIDGFWEQGMGASLQVSPRAPVAFNLFGDLRFGDVDAALVMLMAMYRLNP